LLSLSAGVWKGEIPYGDSTVGLFLGSANAEPEDDILGLALEAVRGLDRFVPIAQGYLALQPAYRGTTDFLVPVGISVTRPDPALILARLAREGSVPLRFAPQGQPMWGLQFQAPGGNDVLEVFFFRGIPIFADYH